ncbi:13839_t:CDS:2, partial [Entrophospora sp. SA101]
PDLFPLNNTISYENNKSGRELLKSISESIELVIWNELKNCKAFGVMVDESTDISTNSHFIIYVKYCYKGIVKVRYLKLLQVEESNAITLYNAIINLFDKNDIVKKICSFASDGASVMMGKNTGVATRIAQINHFLYITHCIAHRLSLACGDAQEQVEFCKSVESVMKKVYLFFSKSSKRCDLLKHYQKFLDHPLLKVKQIYDIRWLSWYDAVKTFLYFLYDILGYLSELSKVFQKRFIRFSDLQPTIEATLEKIQHEYLEDNPRLGYNLSGFLTNISPTSNLYIGNHKLIFNNGYEDDLMVDICEFASSII